MSRSHAQLLRLRKEEAIEFRLFYAVSFTVFLLAATIARCLPREWRPYPLGQEDHKSIFGEARAAANEIVPFAFMS